MTTRKSALKELGLWASENRNKLFKYKKKQSQLLLVFAHPFPDSEGESAIPQGGRGHRNEPDLASDCTGGGFQGRQLGRRGAHRVGFRERRKCQGTWAAAGEAAN